MNNFNSKKFVFACLGLFALTGLLFTALLSQPFTIVMASFMSIGILGIVGLVIGYVLPQAKLDRVTKMMSDVLTKGE